MSTEQLNTEVIVDEVKDVVTENVPESAPAVETAETVEEVVNDVTEEKKTKSFFDIFKKDKKVEEDADAPAEVAETTEGEATPVEGEATEAVEEVPVETASAKKNRLCGLCAFGKKTDAAEEAPVAEEAASAETTTEAAPVTEETVAEPVVEEPIVAAAETTEEAVAPVVETTEGEAVAPAIEADVVRCGVLFKSGKFFKSNMNERHCRVLSTGLFQWSKTDEFSKAHECKISSETTTVAFMAEGEEAAHKYRFELHCCGSVTTYAVDTEEDRDEWIRAIETIKESVVPAAVAGEATVAEEAAPAEETPVAAAE